MTNNHSLLENDSLTFIKQCINAGKSNASSVMQVLFFKKF